MFMQETDPTYAQTDNLELTNKKTSTGKDRAII
jgi:hypothetical protein